MTLNTNSAIPLRYRGRELHASKAFSSDGQQRSKDPKETFAKIIPVAKACGITRVADITGLDRIGVPVTSVVRPASLTLSTASGKGLTREIAAVSGVMEAIELHHAETAVLKLKHASHDELSQNYSIIELANLNCKRGSLFRPQVPEFWTNGWDIIQQKEVYVPVQNVLLKKTEGYGRTSFALFQEDSNGLASGNNLAEAVCSAILELVERDAVTCIEHATASVGYRPTRVNVARIEYDSVRSLLDRLNNADIDVCLYDYRIDTGIPVFKALIYDRETNNFGPGGGYGAHLDPEIAILRALTESIQGRAVVISGVRDDVFRFDLFKIRNSEMSRFRMREKSENPTPISYINESTDTFHGDLGIIVEKLRAVNVTSIIVFDLSFEKSDFSVVRVVAPELEGYRWKNSYMPRRRATTFARSIANKAGYCTPLEIQLAAGERS